MKCILLALCFCIAGVIYAQQPAAVPHTFTATDGRKLTATIVGTTDSAVTIRRAEDGKEFVLPLDRVSAEDQAFVQAWGTKAATAVGLAPVEPPPTPGLRRVGCRGDEPHAPLVAA